MRSPNLPPRNPRTKNVYLLYVLFAEHRDELHKYCLENGVDAKIHYPIPVYLQDALKFLGYKRGDFPVTDRQTEEVISFPVDQYLTQVQQDHVIDTVRSFYRGKRS